MCSQVIDGAVGIEPFRIPGGFMIAIESGSMPDSSMVGPGRDQLLMNVGVYGGWRRDEVHHFSYHDADLYLFGQFLGARTAIEREFAAAVEGRNPDAVSCWPGSYAAVIRQGQVIRVYQDLAGQFALYYGKSGSQILIASDPTLIASLHARSHDLVTIAARISFLDVLPLWWECSPFCEIHRLEAGGVLEVTTNGHGEPRLTKPVTRKAGAANDATAALRAGLQEAISLRCAGRRVSTDFSGGLDSSSLAFMAAKHTKSPLPAVVYHQTLAPASDLAQAERYARLSAELDLTIVRGGADTLPYASLADAYENHAPLWAAAPRHAEPMPGVLTWRAAARRLLTVAERRSELHLTGEGGDALLMAAPSYLASLARRGSYRAMVAHCHAYGRLRHTSPIGLAGRATRLALTSHRRALRLFAADVENPKAQIPNWGETIRWWSYSGESAGWLTQDMRKQLAQRARDPAAAAAITLGQSPADVAAQVQLRNAADAQRQLRDVGRGYDLPVHAPFLDSRVVSAVLSLPAAERADPWTYKPMLRAGVAGLVPDELLKRRTKGDYTAEDYVGARRAMPALRSLLGDSHLADLGIIEPTAVASTLERFSAGVVVPLGPLNMLLATELWLRGTQEDLYRSLQPCPI